MSQGRRFDGGQGFGPISVDPATNLPVFTTDNNMLIPIPVGAPPSALHLDPSFEDPAGTDWEDFYRIGTPVITPDSAAVFSGTLAARISLAPGEEQIRMSSTFGVGPGRVVEEGVWSFGDIGNIAVSLGMVSTAAGTPNLFDPATAFQEVDAQDLLGLDYEQVKATFGVPAGHTQARMFFRVKTSDGLAGEALVDLSFSSITGTAVPNIEWMAAAQATDVTPSGTTNSDVTDLDGTLTTSSEQTAWRVDVVADVAFTGTQTNIVELLVDGAARAGQIIQSGISGDRSNGSQFWIVTGLAAGSHTLSVRTRNNEPGSGATVKANHTRFIATRISG